MSHKEILEFIEENNVKFIRLGFCDPLGIPKNISILASELEDAFSDGRPIDASAISVFKEMSNTDLLLFPDPTSLSLMPWRPQTNSVLRFYCDVKKADKTAFAGDGRYILKNAVNKLNSLGFACTMGTKCEFYLFKTDEYDEPTMKTLDEGSYLDIAPLDKGENIRREICLCLEEMGLKPKNSHHERGPGQNEIDFKSSDPLSAADNFLTFKSVVKSIAARNGLFASFMPKPFLDKSGSGMHLDICLYKDGVNILKNYDAPNFKYAKHFLAGILEKAPEITLFLNPINNSYERFGAFEAPKHVSWSLEKRTQLVRIPPAVKGKERLELRSPDPTVNPHLAFALVLYAGIYGIEHALELPPATGLDLNDTDIKTLKSLPENLGEAIEIARNSDFLKTHIDEKYLQIYIGQKEKEFEKFTQTNNKEKYYNEIDFKML